MPKILSIILKAFMNSQYWKLFTIHLKKHSISDIANHLFSLQAPHNIFTFIIYLELSKKCSKSFFQENT